MTDFMSFIGEFRLLPLRVPPLPDPEHRTCSFFIEALPKFPLFNLFFALCVAKHQEVRYMHSLATC